MWLTACAKCWVFLLSLYIFSDDGTTVSMQNIDSKGVHQKTNYIKEAMIRFQEVPPPSIFAKTSVM